MISPSRMIEPPLLLNSLICLKELAIVGVTINNFYVEGLKKQFSDPQTYEAKIQGSALLFLFNIFDKKKRQVIFIIKKKLKKRGKFQYFIEKMVNL